MTPNARFADLRGASVFITGGGSGIGAALSVLFLASKSSAMLTGQVIAVDGGVVVTG